MEIKLVRSDGSVTECRHADVLIIGTHGQGQITCTYAKLVKAFGQPEEGDGCKTQVEWTVATPAGIATIYDWKQGACYCGEEDGIPAGEVTEWNIGGHTELVITWLLRAINKKA